MNIDPGAFDVERLPPYFSTYAARSIFEGVLDVKDLWNIFLT